MTFQYLLSMLNGEPDELGVETWSSTVRRDYAAITRSFDKSTAAIASYVMEPHCRTKEELRALPETKGAAEYVRIGESTLPNAGDGLFAIKTFRCDAWICEYKGQYVQAEEIDPENDYILSWPDDGVFLDHTPPNCCYARYANDALNPCFDNACLARRVVRIRGKPVVQYGLVALHGIDVGEEIFVSYGTEFWDGVHFPIPLYLKAAARYKFEPDILSRSSRKRSLV